MNQMKNPLRAAVVVLMRAVHASAQQGPGLRGTVAQEPGPPTRVFGALGWEEPGMPSTTVPPQLADVTFEQRLNDRLPLDARFRDETGRAVTLRAYFGKKPVVLAFVYYQCPMLCSQIMNGVSGALKAVPFVPGQDFDVVYVSFDPRDTPETATAKKQAVLTSYKELESAAGWHFLTG